MKLPYSKLDLLVALLSIKEDKISVEKGEEITEEILERRLPSDNARINILIAEHNGISVIDLINSPNYQTLCQEYVDSVYTELVTKLAEAFELTEKQAWAGMAAAQGLLD